MASITLQTSAEVDSALNFLGKQQNPPVSGEEYFQARVKQVVNDCQKEASDKRFNIVKELMDDKNKEGSIKKLRELLG
jgi:hypothetical protein